jgi:hypothetical protein
MQHSSKACYLIPSQTTQPFSLMAMFFREIVGRDPVRPSKYVVTRIVDWEEAGFYPL